MRKVTPRAGVWIETRCRALPRRLRTRSLPVRECGLKQGVGPEASVDRVSLPVRECGLKRKLAAIATGRQSSLPVRECGLKQDAREVGAINLLSLPVRECGLKPRRDTLNESTLCHSPCGSVD